MKLLLILVALTPSLGASTLERIRGLETDNEAMRGLLKRVFDAAAYPNCKQNPGELAAAWATIDAYPKGGEPK